MNLKKLLKKLVEDGTLVNVRHNGQLYGYNVRLSYNATTKDYFYVAQLSGSTHAKYFKAKHVDLVVIDQSGTTINLNKHMCYV